MKKKITTIWSVGLTLVLATTMLLFPMPASAGTLSWGSETIPSTSGYRLADGNVDDLAASAGGDVIYSVNNTQVMYRSTNGGETWSAIVIDQNLQANFVAVAPDDENYIAVAGNCTADTSAWVYISDDAGANWDSLGNIFSVTGLDDIHDLTLSAAKGGNHYVGVAGTDNTSAAQVAYYKIGGVGAVWTNASTKAGFTGGQEIGGAVAFSPNFASDEVMVAVTANWSSSVDTADGIILQIFTFDQAKWNSSAGFDLYPVEIVGSTADALVDGLDSASISLSPDYLGSDDDMRLSFVGTTTTAGATNADDADGIFRLDEDSVKALKEDKNIHSVAFDGTNLVAGRYDTTGVYRSADPLASSPSVSGSASLKSPGGATLTVVAWAGANVVAGTTGDESAFAVSENDGKTFNDISLIHTTLTVLSDVAVSPDGSNIYLVTGDADGTPDMSLWRYVDRWERVLSNQDADDDFIVRTAPDDMDAVYVADASGTTIYYSTDAGQDKWHTRIFAETSLTDLAVETDGDVVYAVSTGGYVSKSTNSGFTWATKKSSKLSTISMLTSLGEDLLLAGSTDGKAAYSKDGNATWSKLADGMDTGTVQVVANGLDEGDLVIAGTDDSAGGENHLYRWDWDDEEWDEIADLADGLNTFGIALEGGILYAVSENTTNNVSVLHRSLNPTADDPSWDTIESDGEEFISTPSALRLSVSDTTNKLWAIDSVGPYLFSYSDTIAITAPTLLAPREGFENLINPISGKTFDVTFSWVRPSKKVTAYDFQIALDSTFNEVALSQNVVDDSSTVGIVAGPTGSTVTVGTSTLSYTVEYMPDTTYFWRVRVDACTVGGSSYGPIRSPWSDVRSIKVIEAPVSPPVTVAPTPEITVEVPPAPAITVTPEIIIPTPEIVLPAPQVTLPPSPAPVAPIPGWALYAIIFIGAVLVIALIVLIMRTRRPV